MDFNVFFKDNVYILFGILLYMLFNNERHRNDNTRVIVVYTLILFFYVLNSLNLWIMLGIFLFLFFFQFEVLIDDQFKHKIITGLFDKIIDCLYLLIFKYCFLLYLVLLYFMGKVDFNLLNLDNLNYLYYLFSSILIYIYIVLFISNNKFELKSFSETIKSIDPKSFGTFIPISDKKKEILITMEDKTYLYRKSSFTSFSFWIFIFKIRTMIDLIIRHKDKKMLLGKEKIKFNDKVLRVYYFIKRQIRGYSTLEMQLYRQIALEDGYYEIFQRKVSEFVGGQLLFKGLRKYLKRNYTKVSYKRYKDFIIDKYLEYAPVFLGEHRYINYKDLFLDKEVSDCDFIFYVLTLSSKLDKEDVLVDTEIDFSLIKDKYFRLFFEFGISDEELNNTVIWFNEKRKLNC